MFTPTLMSSPSGPDPRLGEVLCGKWRLERVLGAGSMARVYAARHVSNGKCVAVKVLHSSLAQHRVARERLLNEARTANRIGHRAVAGVYDEGETPDGSIFLVMDLLEGTTLEELLSRVGTIPSRDALLIAAQVLDALAAAHARGVVHRDIKPENIFVGSDGRVSLLDFGVARSIQARSMTQMGVPIGTPAFMPPEQAAGNWHLVDERSDLWALGASLFTIISGDTVRQSTGIAEEIAEASTQPVRSLASVCDARASVVAIVDRALQFDRSDRFPDARAMQAAVNEALSELGGPGALDLSSYTLTHEESSGLTQRAHTVELHHGSAELPEEAAASSWLRRVRGGQFRQLFLRRLLPAALLALPVVGLLARMRDAPAETSARSASAQRGTSSAFSPDPVGVPELDVPASSTEAQRTAPPRHAPNGTTTTSGATAPNDSQAAGSESSPSGDSTSSEAKPESDRARSRGLRAKKPKRYQPRRREAAERRTRQPQRTPPSTRRAVPNRPNEAAETHDDEPFDPFRYRK